MTGALPLIINVDNEKENRERVAEILGAGYDIRSYSDGREALEAIRLLKPELTAGRRIVLVTDNQMPHMTGLELLKALADVGLTLPSVLVSGDPAKDIKVSAAGMGAKYDQLVSKPFSANVLRYAVSSLFKQYERRESKPFMERPRAHSETFVG